MLFIDKFIFLSSFIFFTISFILSGNIADIGLFFLENIKVSLINFVNSILNFSFRSFKSFLISEFLSSHNLFINSSFCNNN